jgi:folate-binding protein YgfZ
MNLIDVCNDQPCCCCCCQGCVPMGEADWERLRIVQGRPSPGAELTESYNPLETGLCHAVSISKGCYIGQETIAKVSL